MQAALAMAQQGSSGYAKPQSSAAMPQAPRPPMSAGLGLDLSSLRLQSSSSTPAPLPQRVRPPHRNASQHALSLVPAPSLLALRADPKHMHAPACSDPASRNAVWSPNLLKLWQRRVCVRVCPDALRIQPSLLSCIPDVAALSVKHMRCSRACRACRRPRCRARRSCR